MSNFNLFPAPGDDLATLQFLSLTSNYRTMYNTHDRAVNIYYQRKDDIELLEEEYDRNQQYSLKLASLILLYVDPDDLSSREEAAYRAAKAIKDKLEDIGYSFNPQTIHASSPFYPTTFEFEKTIFQWPLPGQQAAFFGLGDQGLGQYQKLYKQHLALVGENKKLFEKRNHAMRRAADSRRLPVQMKPLVYLVAAYLAAVMDATAAATSEDETEVDDIEIGESFCGRMAPGAKLIIKDFVMDTEEPQIHGFCEIFGHLLDSKVYIKKGKRAGWALFSQFDAAHQAAASLRNLCNFHVDVREYNSLDTQEKELPLARVLNQTNITIFGVEYKVLGEFLDMWKQFGTLLDMRYEREQPISATKGVAVHLNFLNHVSAVKCFTQMLSDHLVEWGDPPLVQISDGQPYDTSQAKLVTAAVTKQKRREEGAAQKARQGSDDKQEVEVSDISGSPLLEPRLLPGINSRVLRVGQTDRQQRSIDPRLLGENLVSLVGQEGVDTGFGGMEDRDIREEKELQNGLKMRNHDGSVDLSNQMLDSETW